MINIFTTRMFRRFTIFLISLGAVVSCFTDYGIMKPGEDNYIYVYDTAVTTVEVEVEVPVEVEVEVEVPVEVIVEVPIYIEVEVEGDVGEIWIDSFRQPNEVDGIDILWVIDTSGSMHRYDDRLLAGIETMLAALPPTNWRLVMISNDPSYAVTESEFPLVPGDDIDDATSMYTIMGRGGVERGFEAVYEYITANPYAATWMRADAALLVVFVSDEEEQSYTVMPTVPDFTSWYSSLRGGSSFISSIVNQEPTISMCPWMVSSIDVGNRYMDATTYFAGIVVDICEEDWSAGVADATRSVAPHEDWELTKTPIEDSIVVFINGSPDYNWVYSAIDNTVYFTVIPSGSALVEIGYRYLLPDTGTP